MSTFEPGHPLTPARLLTDDTALRVNYNSLTADDIAPQGLDRHVLPSLTTLLATAFPTGMTSGYADVEEGSVYDDYKNALPNNSSSPHLPPTYQTFGTAGGGSAPYGPGTFEEGWRIPAHEGVVSRACEVQVGTAGGLNSVTLFTTFGMTRLEVNLFYSIGQFQTISTQAQQRGRYCVVAAVGFADGSGARFVVEDTVRFYSVDNVARRSLHQSHWLQAADFLAPAQADGNVSSIFGVIAAKVVGEDVMTDADNDPVPLGPYSISVFPMRAGSL